jgi:prepilin-type processing-associated H-X9-DG protein
MDEREGVSWKARTTLASILFLLVAMVLYALLSPAWQQHVLTGRKRLQVQQDLHQLALAMYDYESAHARLPPPAIYGSDGQPLLSWRVAILPYLDESALFKEFRLHEPWDSPHNLPLLDRMPKVFAHSGSNSSKSLPKLTYFQVFVGKGTAFESREGLRIPDDFPDGTSKTILIVEAEPPIPWTKPADLLYSPDEPLPKFWTVRQGGYNAAFADGHIMFLEGDNHEARTRARITRNGGEIIPPED